MSEGSSVRVRPPQGEDGTALRRCALLGDRFSNPEAFKRECRVREEGDPRAGWVDARRPLEDDDVVCGAAQSDRGGHAADPSANHDDAHCRDHLVSGWAVQLRPFRSGRGSARRCRGHKVSGPSHAGRTTPLALAPSGRAGRGDPSRRGEPRPRLDRPRGGGHCGLGVNSDAAPSARLPSHAPAAGPAVTTSSRVQYRSVTRSRRAEPKMAAWSSSPSGSGSPSSFTAGYAAQDSRSASPRSR